MTAFNPKLVQVDYKHFRHVVNHFAGHRIKVKGSATYLYDQQNRVLAQLNKACIDTLGQVHPTRYFVNATIH